MYSVQRGLHHHHHHQNRKKNFLKRQNVGHWYGTANFKEGAKYGFSSVLFRESDTLLRL